jgi:hypothetical protein
LELILFIKKKRFDSSFLSRSRVRAREKTAFLFRLGLGVFSPAFQRRSRRTSRNRITSQRIGTLNAKRAGWLAGPGAVQGAT